MTEAYLLHCGCFTESDLFGNTLQNLSEYRRNKIFCAATEPLKLQRLGAGALLDFALKQRGLSEKEMTYQTDFNGKPFFANRSDLYFSLSHSGQWVFCALSDSKIGVDVQILSKYNERIAERYFSEKESLVLSRLSGKKQDFEFTRMWVKKESTVKYFGTWHPQTSIPSVTDFFDEVQMGICTSDIGNMLFRKLLSPKELS